MKKISVIAILILLSWIAGAQIKIKYIKPIASQYIDTILTDQNGQELIKVIIPGCPPPQIGYNKTAATISNTAVLLEDVPAFGWCFGCTATSAAMIAGYYDLHGYSNMYAGPTNDGVCPLNSSSWGNKTINGETRAICPLSATMQNIDGRTSRGHVDDYWIKYGSSEADPYITNNWQQHEYQDCTADFMKTNQSAYGNRDGSTTYYFYPNGNRFEGIPEGDGPYGLQLFFQSRGYQIVTRYTQTIQGYDGNINGFTFADYKNEIDAGRPVMVHVEGHTMVGVGYDEAAQTMYIHNTWDYNIHSMTWGGEYEGMQLISMSAFALQPVSGCTPPVALKTINITNTTADLTWNDLGSGSSWEVEFGPEGFTKGQGTKATVSGTKKLSLTNLSSEKKYIWYVRKVCTDENSEWVGPADFTTYKYPGPQIVSKFPTGTNAEPDAGLQIVFNKQMKAGTGKVSLYKADGSLVDEILSSNCIISGNTVMMPRLFDLNTLYYVLIDNQAFIDESNESFSGISSNTEWTFKTGNRDKLYCQVFDLNGNFLPDADVCFSSPDYYFSPKKTNNYGMVSILVPNTSGDVFISHEGKHYLIEKSDITTPASVVIHLAQETLADLSITGKNDQGNVLPGSEIYLKPSDLDDLIYMGESDSQGTMNCKVSKLLFDHIQLFNLNSQYLLYKKPGIDCRGTTMTFASTLDASQMPVSKINPKFTGTFSSTQLFAGISYYGFLFEMKTPVVTISSGEPIYYGAWLFKNNNLYELDFDGVLSPLSNPAPSVEVNFNDKIELSLKTEKEIYKSGEIVHLTSHVFDSNKNLANWAGNYSPTAETNSHLPIKLIKKPETQDIHFCKQEMDSLTTSVTSVCPRITVTNPNGEQVINYSGREAWDSYEFLLSSPIPSDFTDGDYIVEYSFNFGPWADKLSVKDTFTVQVEAPVIASVFPANLSVLNAPDCIPSFNTNSPVQAGTGMVSIYKSNGTLYSQLPASACVFEGNTVRIPRLLDVNSSFYILTDENAFLNNKGKLAPISSPATWAFTTAGNTVYCQIFDTEGKPLTGTLVYYRRSNGSTYQLSANQYGIYRSGINFPPEETGTLLACSYTLGYLIQKTNIPGVSSYKIELANEPTIVLNISSKDKDNQANNLAEIYMEPYSMGRNINVGHTDQSGNFSLNVSPINLSYISVLNWDKRTVLSTSGIDCSTGQNTYLHEINATELGLTEIHPVLDIFNADEFATYYGHSIAPVLYGTDPVWISSNFPMFRGSRYSKNDPLANLTWSYNLRPDNNQFEIHAGEVQTIYWGDSLQISMKPEKKTYVPGEQVNLINKITDHYDNRLFDCYSDIISSPAEGQSLLSIPQNTYAIETNKEDPGTESKTDDPEKLQTGKGYYYPTITVTSPNGTKLIDYNGYNAWYDFRFALPPDATEGKYYLDYTFNSGPLLGVIAARDSFMVGSFAPELISLFPANQSVLNVPDCIPAITLNSPVQAGTGMVSIYKSNGTLYSQLPASACIFEGNTVRIPRLLDVNSSFYILTDENAFQNSKGKLAPISSPATWAFTTGGNKVYCQIFDADGKPVQFAQIRYRTSTQSFSGYESSIYGIAKLYDQYSLDPMTSGTLMLNARSQGYLIRKNIPSSVSSTIIKLNEEPTVSLIISSKDTNNLPNNLAQIVVDFQPFGIQYCSQTDPLGNCPLHVSPVNIPYITVLNMSSRLILSTNGIDCSTGQTSYIHPVNANELGTAEIRPNITAEKIDGFMLFYGHRVMPGFNGPNPIKISTNFPVNKSARYYKTETATNLLWDYYFSQGNSFNLTTGEIFNDYWGDKITASSKPARSIYLPGDQVEIQNRAEDEYHNRMNSCNNNPNNANTNLPTSNNDIFYINYSDTTSENALEVYTNAAGPDSTQTFASVYPSITITAPDGKKLIEYMGYSAWRVYRYTLPANAADGKYYVDYTLNSGPLRGLLAARDSFMVGVELPVILSLFPANQSVLNDPDCIPTITLNSPVQAGTGMVSIYKSNGTLYSQLPASACVFEGNTVRIPRLLDVNSSFYILTDENAFQNSKGKLAPISSPATWAFTTAGSTMYCQVFDLGGIPSDGASVYFCRTNGSIYSFYTNRYGIYRSGINFSSEETGTLLASSPTLGYLIRKDNVAVVSSTIVKLGAENTKTLTITSKDKENQPNNRARVHIDFSPFALQYSGETDGTGTRILHITPSNIPYITILNADKRLVLSSNGIDCSGDAPIYTHAIDAQTLGLAEIRPKFNYNKIDSCYTYYGHRLAPAFKGENPVWLSSNFTMFRVARYYKSESFTRWDYTLRPDNNQFEINTGEVLTVNWGDSLQIATSPEKPVYKQGERVQLFNKISDQFGNRYQQCYTYTLPANQANTNVKNPGLKADSVVFPDNQDMLLINSGTTSGPDITQTNASLYPNLIVTSPNQSKLADINVWFDYGFTLPVSADNGKYYIDYSFNSGPLAGMVAARDSFTVGLDYYAPVILSFTPANMSINVPRGLSQLVITFDENIRIGTGAVKLYNNSDVLIETISNQNWVINARTLTIPISALAYNTIYYVLIDAGAVQNLGGNAFAGISNKGQFTFRTELEPVPAAHFTPVWTGNGVDQMSFNIVIAKLDGTDLQAHDEIAVFDGTKCVGVGKLNSVISSQNALTFIASKDDGSGNGYTAGNPITFKIWDLSQQKEYTVSATYLNEQPTWSTSGKYEANATCFVEINAVSQATQTISLSNGWNILSANVLPENKDLMHNMQTLVDAGKLVKVQDERGKTVENWGIFGGWKNQVGDMAASEGYKVKVNADCSLELTGVPTQLPSDIDLSNGWNIISFPHTAEANGTDVMQALVNAGTLVKVQDEKGQTIENWGIFGGWKNLIGNFKPGEGYKVKVNQDTKLTINSSYTKSTAVPVQLAQAEHFAAAFTGNGTDHMDINLVDLQESILEPGDEIVAFDKGLCVGSVKITERNLKNGTAQLIASANDQSGSPGFAEGNKIELKLWKQATGDECNLPVEFVSGSTSFEKNESSFVSLKNSATDIENLISENGFSFICYPNPTDGLLYIQFDGNPEQGIMLQLFDMTGKKLVERTINNKTEQLNLKHLAKGVYYVKIITNNTPYIQKIILN